MHAHRYVLAKHAIDVLSIQYHKPYCWQVNTRTLLTHTRVFEQVALYLSPSRTIE